MLRVLVILVAFLGVARAEMHVSEDPNRDARKLNEETLARYDSEIGSRNPLLRLYDLFDDARITNCKNARLHFVESKQAFDKVPKDDVPELHYRLREMQDAAKMVDRSIDAYRAEAKSTMLKMIAGLGLVVLLVFGGAIWAIVKRRSARFVPGRRY